MAAARRAAAENGHRPVCGGEPCDRVLDVAGLRRRARRAKAGLVGHVGLRGLHVQRERYQYRPWPSRQGRPHRALHEFGNPGS